MRNKLSDLNNHLFCEIERLTDEDLEGDALDQEIKRAQAVSNVSDKIIQNSKMQLDAIKIQLEYGDTENPALRTMIDAPKTDGNKDA